MTWCTCHPDVRLIGFSLIQKASIGRSSSNWLQFAATPPGEPGSPLAKNAEGTGKPQSYLLLLTSFLLYPPANNDDHDGHDLSLSLISRLPSLYDLPPAVTPFIALPAFAFFSPRAFDCAAHGSFRQHLSPTIIRA
ncbi:hypothetical protein S7711_04020 [Stachybotrys chartarum IBT 7711]|uniref:Uncharacterized protein n=1 Tax=Stachybotrys chartarum (strain CBS 109288 / IBT 7711) TaxID=1280523 RepID=A0A084AXH5_STACB|nr:hypothetical protein S7711_04020 [Stachybotrys chartarum IBT 7711]KFA50771.1 hypothetical protein S40293_06105 [Stachybotrys chartarum IBT 40293]